MKAKLFTHEKIGVIVDHSWAVITAKSAHGVACTNLRRLGHLARALDWVPGIIFVFFLFSSATIPSVEPVEPKFDKISSWVLLNSKKWKKKVFWGKFRINSDVLRVARGGYGACRAPRENKMLSLGDCFPQPCSSDGRRFAASRSRFNYHWTLGLFPQERIRWNPL